ncbi:MAG: L,D-transpeptidase [Bdellovibrionales bacterium]|nr:L,D-transpeptidase [Bdellovibrionales bacterium]
MKNLCAKLAAVSSLAFLCSCSTVTTSDRPLAANWMPDGMIALSRPAPQVSEESITRAFAFLPLQTVHAGPWLLIDTSQGEMSLMDGSKTISIANGEGVKSLTPGTYQLLHKQRNALWYAPDSYFEKRSLPVPGKGDRARFRRGALGDFVLFLSKETPIHCGPIWSDEIGGVRMPEDELSRVYYRLPVGSLIEVR